ncbi:transcriptional regulator [Patulibacter medicamentivorans]|uniref:Transcriptional regulator n=1 Tax=Patulibacter medicamentivorans TaxID=1097667 RepID=H0E7X3_9ACTN|nr:LysR family transcriptional regulator [Patulibacter medicamentivorans]EHN10171.1 transcriptional regulator [Patulibacter medicamentivorans]
MFAIRQLEALVAVAETEHFGRAGARLGTTTSAVSGLIARLEREAGVALVRRTTRRVCLTAEGVAVLGQARAVVAAARRLTERVAAVAEGRVGVVRIGVSSDCRQAGQRVARAVRAATAPGWSVRTEVRAAADVGERFDEGRLELLVTRRPLARRQRPWWHKPWSQRRRDRRAFALEPGPAAVRAVWDPAWSPPVTVAELRRSAPTRSP